MSSLASSPRHRAARRAPLRAMLTATSAFAGATLIGLGAAGTTLAVWNGAISMNGPTIASGTSELTVETVDKYTVPNLDLSQLLPGRSVVSAPFSVENGGNVSLDISVSPATFESGVAALTDSLTFAISHTCSPTPGNAPLGSAPFTIADGDSTMVCLEARLATDAHTDAQGELATFTLTLDGVQSVTP